jgi:hypothetical protein
MNVLHPSKSKRRSRGESCSPVCVEHLDAYIAAVLPEFDKIRGERLSFETLGADAPFLELEVYPSGEVVHRLSGVLSAEYINRHRRIFGEYGFREVRIGRFERRLGFLPSAERLREETEQAFARLGISVWTVAFRRIPKGHGKDALTHWLKGGKRYEVSHQNFAR